MEIRTLKLNDWKEYKKLRLIALQEVPVAFAEGYDTCKDKSVSYWKSLMKTKNCTTFGMWDKDSLIANVTLRTNELQNFKHVANIFAVYTHPDYRRKGISTKLFKKIFSHARGQKVKKIKLTVTKNNVPAVNVYKKLGFTKIAILEKEIKYKNKFYDELLMAKFL